LRLEKERIGIENERLDNSKVILSRNNQDDIMEESLKVHMEIPSDDFVVRQDMINKEMDFIRKKWSEMNQSQLEKKMKLEKEMYDNDRSLKCSKKSKKI
jgi:hypothetical protein